jgi:putative transposase
MKGKSSYKLLTEFQHLRKAFWAGTCGRGYFCVSSGNVTDGVIQGYIENRLKRGTGTLRCR